MTLKGSKILIGMPSIMIGEENVQVVIGDAR
jgi:hypothetical protein